MAVVPNAASAASAYRDCVVSGCDAVRVIRNFLIATSATARPVTATTTTAARYDEVITIANPARSPGHHQRLLKGHQVNAVPEISHVVEVSFRAVATPYCARVREPVVPALARYIVSLLIAMVTACEVMFVNVSTVPIA